MASIFQAFDLNEALAGAKQPRRHVAGGFEAPRNSLDVGSSFEAAGASSSDIPFGYEYYNGQWKRDHGRREQKRRVPNVVARLMGLDALPDELPRKSLQEMPTHGPNPVLIRQHSQGAVPAAWQRPPLPRSSGERPLSPVLPFRDHPQEEQLQRFKKEFEAKQKERLVASQLEEMNRQLEDKKNKVRATLDKARVALSQGVIADPKRQGKFEESKEFLDAMEFLQCNKDFIFQFLQQKPHVVFSNENSTVTTPVAHAKPLKKGKGSSPGDNLPERKREGFSPRAIARLFMPSESRKRSRDQHKQQQQPATSSALERSSSAGHSSRMSASALDSSDDVKLTTSISTNSRYMLPLAAVKPSSDEARGNKNGAQAVIMEIKERLRRRDENSRPGDEAVNRVSKDAVIRTEQNLLRDSKEIAREIAKQAREAGSRKSTHSTLTKSLSTGKRISMMRPDMDDMTCTSDREDVSTPSVKIVRENVTRSCISLPSSPHLSARSHEAAAAPKIMRKGDAKPLLTEPTDSLTCTSDREDVSTPSVKIVRENVTRSCISLPSSPHLSARSHEAAAAPKIMRKRDAKPLLTEPTDSPRASVTKKTPASPRSRTDGEKRMRRSASVNENAARSNALKQKINSPVSTSKKVLNEPVSSLTRSRSVPNVALLRERGQHATDTTKNAPEATARGQKKLGFFSVSRKKGKDGYAHLDTTPSPVLSRVAALAEACVSQSHTLSDADSAANVRIRSGSRKGKDLKPRQVVVSPSAVESVVPESSADSDGAPCEGEFLEVLSQLTKKHPAPGNPRARTVCPPSPRTHQVQSAKKGTPKPRKPARNILEKKDDDSDKNGQPSPVSVLEPPFKDKISSSPPELKEITNDLQELRVRLHFKFNGRERTVPEKKSHSNAALLPGPESDFAFVRDILVTSGFHTHGGRNIARWHSSTQPISHHVLEKVDFTGAAHRRILFDAVNEVLVAHLDPQCFEQPWLQILGKPRAHVATGRRLVEQVWSEIRKRQFPAPLQQQMHGEYLESLVAQDLQTSSTWSSLHREADRICLHLEKAILNDLLEELVNQCQRLR